MPPPSPDRQASVRLLLVEDASGDAALVQEILEQAAPGRFEVHHTMTLSDAVIAACSHTFDCALLDLNLPDSRGIETFVEMRIRHPGLPVVILTGVDDETLANQSVAANAQDWLAKGHLDPYTLPRSIRWAVDRQRTMADLQRAVAERDTANEALMEANVLKAAFVAIASHELRTPVTVLKGFLHILGQRWEQLGTDELQGFFEVLSRNADRLAEYVEDLLLISRLEARAVSTADARPVSLRDLAEESVTASRLNGHAIDLAIQPDLVAHLDPGHLVRVLTSLLDNAVKYGQAPYQLAASMGPDDTVQLRVIDHGDGVPEEFAPHMFETFTRAPDTASEQSGTGLGLAIAHALAGVMGGSVSYGRTVEDATCFTFTVPSTTPQPGSANAADSGRTRPPQQSEWPERMGYRHVLVVDDEPGSRRLMTLILEATGNTRVTQCADVVTAMEQYRQLRFDLVVLDQRLGSAQQGLDIAMEILTMHPTQTLALCTAYLTPEVTELAEGLGITSIISKDELQQLAELVR